MCNNKKKWKRISYADSALQEAKTAEREFVTLYGSLEKVYKDEQCGSEDRWLDQTLKLALIDKSTATDPRDEASRKLIAALVKVNKTAESVGSKDFLNTKRTVVGASCTNKYSNCRTFAKTSMCSRRLANGNPVFLVCAE